MKNALLFSLFIITGLFVSCDKGQTRTPNYFDDLDASHEVTSSCGFADVYVAITDTSQIGFHLDDTELNIDTIGTVMDVSDLIE